MKTRSKALLLVLCAVLLVTASVLGTMAYLTDKDEVTNTFTVGKVKITLDEAPVNDEGKATTGNRVKENKYHLLPGHTYDKDPTVTVKADSEASYVRMLVHVSNIANLKAAFPQATYADYYAADGTFLLQKLVDGWDSTEWPCAGYKADENNGAGGTYEFRYYKTTESSKQDVQLKALFKTITIPGTVDGNALEKLNNIEIKITAQAIQASGFEADTENNKTAEDVAWDNFTYTAPTTEGGN